MSETTINPFPNNTKVETGRHKRRHLTFTFLFKKSLTFQCFCFPFSNKRGWWDDTPDCQPFFWTSTTHVVRSQTSSPFKQMGSTLQKKKDKKRHLLADVIVAVCIYKTDGKGRIHLVLTFSHRSAKFFKLWKKQWAAVRQCSLLRSVNCLAVCRLYFIGYL